MLVFFLLIVIWYTREGNIASLRNVSSSAPRFFAPSYISEREAATGSADESSADTARTKAPDGLFNANLPQNFAGLVTLSAGRSRATAPEEEFVELRLAAHAPAPISITGWTLQNRAGQRVLIGRGASVLFPPPAGSAAEPILLRPGDKAIITTGRGPTNVSFRLNWCTGYLDQTRQYIPALARDCPQLSPTLEPELALQDACLDYIEREVPRCAHVDPPITLPPLCREYILEHTRYKSCFEHYRNAEGFFADEWRIFLQQDQELWKAERETITLRDAQDVVIDRITY